MAGHRTGQHTLAARGESGTSLTSQYQGPSAVSSAPKTRLIRPVFDLYLGLLAEQKGSDGARRGQARGVV